MIVIERTKDYELVDSILNLPEIIETISATKLDAPFKTPRDESIYYLLAKHESEPVGVFVVHKDGPCSYKLHANIPKANRKKHSKEACDNVVKWIWDNIDTNKLNAEIPVIYPNVINRALLMGYELEGVKRKAFLKDGNEIDVVIMGMVRSR